MHLPDKQGLGRVSVAYEAVRQCLVMLGFDRVES